MPETDEVAASTADLRRLLSRRTITAIEETKSGKREVSQADVESLERLERLLDLHARLQPKARSRRSWSFGIVLVATLVLLSALLFIRESETPIEADLDVSEIAFTLPSEQIFFETLSLTALDVSGDARASLPEPVVKKVGSTDDGQGDGRISLTAIDAAGRRGSISIVRMRPDAGTRVAVRLMNDAGLYRLSLEGSKSPITVGIVGPMNVEWLQKVTPVDLERPRGVVLESLGRPVALDLTFRDPARVAASPQLRIENPSFWQAQSDADRIVSVMRSVSTILGGTLYFESTGGTRQMRAGEGLDFQRATGEIRSLRLHPDHISLSFHGAVAGMTTGDDDGRRSLMPTWLDVLRAQHGLELLWGSAIYLSGLAMGVYRWWKGAQ